MIEIHQTSRQGDRLARTEADAPAGPRPDRVLTVDASRTHQTMLGFGGSFTESGASVLAELSAERRAEVLAAHFGPDGSRYSLTRTHIASCDFSVRNYTYAPVPDDTALAHFSIEPDRTYLLPMIHEARAVPGADFRILASPWTAPPWMKTNGTWNGGELKPEHHATFAAYLVKYLEAYRREGIPIWGLTPINEPLGNDEKWESTHFTPQQMRAFIVDHLAPALARAGLDTGIWIYDQNRDRCLLEWAEAILGDEAAAAVVAGVAVHWYQSTVDVGGAMLDEVRRRFPRHAILHTEGCIDAVGDDEPIGSWLDDDWYWRPEATDWGMLWAPEEEKPHHPAYRPFHRYARDLVGGLNHGLVGWIDWNMVLNLRGGPNHARNMCLAPILVDSGRDRVHYTPLYYAVAHLSRFVRPGARRIGLDGHDDRLMATALRNPDGTVVVVVFNPGEQDVRYELVRDDESARVTVPGQALQTVVLS
ncbi:glycosyl hydrolase family 30 [bacterium]|nr:glycosyl hydrolase family 30 [bacterium]